MAEEIGFENGRNSNFQGLVTLTLTLDPAIRHTVVHHSSTSTYIPNFIQIEETFCGRTYGRMDGRTFSPLSNIIRSTFGSRPKKSVTAVVAFFSFFSVSIIISYKTISSYSHTSLSSTLHVSTGYDNFGILGVRWTRSQQRHLYTRLLHQVELL